MATRKDSTEYTKKVVDAICFNLKMGIGRRECWCGIISEETYYKWFNQRAEFKQAVELAELSCKKKAIFIIQNAMVNDPSWAAWWLERKHFSEFSLKNKLEMQLTFRPSDKLKVIDNEKLIEVVTRDEIDTHKE